MGENVTENILRPRQVAAIAALLATGKCQDVGMSLDNAMAQPYMMLTLRNIADGSEQELRQMIRDTVQHELGHYFGLEEDELPF